MAQRNAGLKRLLDAVFTDVLPPAEKRMGDIVFGEFILLKITDAAGRKIGECPQIVIAEFPQWVADQRLGA